MYPYVYIVFCCALWIAVGSWYCVCAMFITPICIGIWALLMNPAGVFVMYPVTGPGACCAAILYPFSELYIGFSAATFGLTRLDVVCMCCTDTFVEFLDRPKFWPIGGVTAPPSWFTFMFVW